MIIDSIDYKKIDYKGGIVYVSKNGDIICNGKKRRIYYNPDGCSICAIKTKNDWRSVSVARLVALAYVPNPMNLPEVNHKDFNRKNPKAENLEWVSHLDNIRYSIEHYPDKHGERNPNYGNRKLSKIYSENKKLAKEKQSRPKLQNGRCRKINMYKNGKLIKTFDYIGECCDYLNSISDKSVCKESIRYGIDRACNAKREYRGYTFVKE